ncbi:small ribosomal subunit protein eS27-like [Tenrec ecaudatus]|uniref:small ribosomal subunit protein eS27-like n=1 Tax=Tenrec ecaudatus TaxID=94439 RepID=UPI003F5AA52C
MALSVNGRYGRGDGETSVEVTMSDQNLSFSLCGADDRSAIKPLAKDLLHPSPEEEKRKHKKKRLVQSPNSYFIDVKCPGCYKITTVFSHAQTVVLCVGCSTVLCQPTGGKARLTEGCSFRRKQHQKARSRDEWEAILINPFWIKFLKIEFYFVNH